MSVDLKRHIHTLNPCASACLNVYWLQLRDAITLLKDKIIFKIKLGNLHPEPTIMALNRCLRLKQDCDQVVDNLPSSLSRKLQSTATCPTGWAIFSYTDTNYPPWANFTKCDAASYPIVLSAKFNTPGQSGRTSIAWSRLAPPASSPYNLVWP